MRAIPNERMGGRLIHNRKTDGRLRHSVFHFPFIPSFLPSNSSCSPSPPLSLPMDPDTEIQFEMIPFLRQYKSGRLERFFESQFLPPSLDPSATAAASKDVTIDPTTGVAARLYLPALPTKPKPNPKLPVLIYYHGGGFCIETPYSPVYHPYLTALAARARVVAVSVHYRRMPEHPLPAAYEDSWAALQWVLSHAADSGGVEQWLAEHADFDSVFLAGDSAGANIAHHMAMRAGAEGVRIKGVALMHPFFAGKEAIGEEPRDEELRGRLWKLVFPSSEGLDDLWVNPVGPNAPSLKGLAGEMVMVSMAEGDRLRDRGRKYYEGLRESGWEGKLEVVETEGEGHVFHLLNPSCEKALDLMERMVAFLNRE